MELKGTKVNFLGDSITAGYGVSSEDKVYPRLIKEWYGLDVARNYGISGTRFAKQQDPDDEYERLGNFCTRMRDMDRDADAVVVFGGTNDFGHGDAPIGTFADRTPDTFYGACHDLFSNLINLFPRAQLLVLTPLHTTAELFDKEVPLITYVEIIKEVAAFYAIPVLDAYATSGMQPLIESNRRLLMPDGLHPNDEGQKLLARKIGNYLLTL